MPIFHLKFLRKHRFSGLAVFPKSGSDVLASSTRILASPGVTGGRFSIAGSLREIQNLGPTSNPLREICIWTKPTGDSGAPCSLSQPALESGIHGLILGEPVPRLVRRPLLAAGSLRSEGSRRTWAHTSAPGGAEDQGPEVPAERSAEELR